MTRARARAPKGQRAVGSIPNGHWQTMTLIGALRLEGIVAAVTVDAPTDSDLFRLFVKNALAPALRKGDLVVMDNLSPHKASGVRQMIEATGAELMYLPPYSPDLSPIEPCWSKVKEHLRTVGPRTNARLGKSAHDAFAAVSASDARGWFANCGYVVH